MLSIRIVAAGALISVMTVGGAVAQTATDTGAGKPIQLLQVATQPDKTKSKPHAKRIMKIRTAAKRTGRRHRLAAERPIHVAEAAKPAAPAPCAAPADVWANVTPVTAPATVASAAPAPQLAAASPPSQRRANSWSEAKPCTLFPRTMPMKSIAPPTRRLLRRLRQRRALSLRQRPRRTPQPLPGRRSRRAMSAARPGSRRSWRRSVARSRPAPPPGS